MSKESAEKAEKLRRRYLGGIPVSVILGVLMWSALVYMAGPWNVVSNTRFLDLLMDSGIVALTDADMGWVEYIPKAKYYVASQDPVDWHVILIVIGIFLLFWGLKALQFHDIARHHGVRHGVADNARAYFQGLFKERTLPWGFGEAGSVAELEARGVDRAKSHSIVFLANAFIIFEIVVFAIFGLLNFGWAAWFSQLFWATLILIGAYLWSRGSKEQRQETPSGWQAIKFHASQLFNTPSRLFRLSLLSILAFGLEDVAAYFVAQSFTTSNVILNVDFSVLLMGVLGSYIARFIRLTPGGIGQFEWGFATGLWLGGVGLPEAATIAILDNAFRYISLAILWVLTYAAPAARTTFRDTLDVLSGQDVETEITPGKLPELTDELEEVPVVPAPFVPEPYLVWQRILLFAWLAVIYFFDRFTMLLADFWMLQSLDLASVFWTNFRMGAKLFVLTFIGFFAAATVPAFLHKLTTRQKSLAAQSGVQVGLFAAIQMASQYLSFLVYDGESFGQKDPIFGNDISFYVFQLPNIEIVLTALISCSVVLTVSSVICANVSRRNDAAAEPSMALGDWFTDVATPATQAGIALTGLFSAIDIWYDRYNILYRDNTYSAIPTGADVLDAQGLFSTVNQIRLTSIVVLISTVLLVLIIRAYRSTPAGQKPQVQGTAKALLGVILLDFVFAGCVYVRDLVSVRPNEPVNQMPYIQHHLDATRKAYGIEDIELVDFVPKGDKDPLPTAEQLLDSPVLKNAPLWPPYTSYLEPLLDPQHSLRVLQTMGDHMVYGPTLEIFRQQQKLRTYYNFMSVDPLRFEIDGETKVFVSSVRELPLLDPQPWLTWWGQRFLLFTHGYGLVMAPMGEVTETGGPVYASSSIPVETANDAFAVENPRVYFGEGSVTMAISNINGLQEFDYPTSQGRATNVGTDFSDTGVPIDSALKRVVFAWRSGQYFEVLFSNLLNEKTRLQYYRTPRGRLMHFAPFLYVDSNLYAVPAGDEIVWLANGLTHTDHYPYSKQEYLGDKSISRQEENIETVKVNYVEDSVKATINAVTGRVKLYKTADAPIVNSWQKIYPEMFSDGLDSMPEKVRQQVTYPLQLFHIQFDDIYNIYHMSEAEYFFNMEDMWDDGDEVLGPILDEGESITFSIEPYQVLLKTGGALPESSNGTQFSMVAVFTPENALNLRAVPMVYQDGEDYGRLIVLQVPKGTYVLGPEQADAAIDQDPLIAQQISLWNRQGTEVLRGHTSLLVVDDELLYIEPLYIRSAQNPITQLKQVVVVFRGKPYMAATLEAAIKMATEQPEKEASSESEFVPPRTTEMDEDAEV